MVNWKETQIPLDPKTPGAVRLSVREKHTPNSKRKYTRLDLYLLLESYHFLLEGGGASVW